MAATVARSPSLLSLGQPMPSTSAEVIDVDALDDIPIPLPLTASSSNSQSHLPQSRFGGTGRRDLDAPLAAPARRSHPSHDANPDVIVIDSDSDNETLSRRSARQTRPLPRPHTFRRPPAFPAVLDPDEAINLLDNEDSDDEVLIRPTRRRRRMSPPYYPHHSISPPPPVPPVPQQYRADQSLPFRVPAPQFGVARVARADRDEGLPPAGPSNGNNVANSLDDTRPRRPRLGGALMAVNNEHRTRGPVHHHHVIRNADPDLADNQNHNPGGGRGFMNTIRHLVDLMDFRRAVAPPAPPPAPLPHGDGEENDHDLLFDRNYFGIPPPAAWAMLGLPDRIGRFDVFRGRAGRRTEDEYKKEYTHPAVVFEAGFVTDFAEREEEEEKVARDLSKGNGMDNPIVLDDADEGEKSLKAKILLVCVKCREGLMLTSSTTKEMSVEEERGRKVWALRCGHVFCGGCLNTFSVPPVVAEKGKEKEIVEQTTREGESYVMDADGVEDYRARLRSRHHVPPSPPPLPFSRKRARGKQVVLEQRYTWECPVTGCGKEHESVRFRRQLPKGKGKARDTDDAEEYWGEWAPDKDRGRGAIGMFV